MRVSKETILKLLRSWSLTENLINSTDELLRWIKQRNAEIYVNINHIRLSESDFWYLDQQDFCIRNKNRSFFEISGMRVKENENIICEQPVIIQSENGILGCICKEIDGIIYLLMQAKIEPGNINRVQISPTIQATKSNFTQKHGGTRPLYLDYFLNADRYEIILDQLQSEQSSRFYKKRNRNIIIKINDDDIEISPNHKWMTLGQIKQLLRYDNLVNMDTRTVISCIPYASFSYTDDELCYIKGLFKDNALYQSIFTGGTYGEIPEVYRYINDYKMFNEYQTFLVPLNELSEWEISDYGVICRNENNFKVIFCDITIEGREVKRWTQPLFEATGTALFGLITCVKNGVRYFLVKAFPEIGCFDKIELGPSIQMESNDIRKAKTDTDSFEAYFIKRLSEKSGDIIKDVILSEEGGRFYQEQNRNIILEVPSADMDMLYNLPKGYFMLDYKTLNIMMLINNCLNIQLRNLLALLEV